MRNKNWFWGLFLLLSAVFVLASQTGIFGKIGVFTLLSTILLVAFLVQSVVERSFFGMFISLAFLYMIYAKPLHLAHISGGVLLLSAVLMSSGLHMLFGKRQCKKWTGTPPMNDTGYTAGTCGQSTENLDDNNPYAKVSFGTSIKYLHGNALKSGQFIVSLGTMEVFFDQAMPDVDGAEVMIDCNLGSLKLFVPRHWQVYDNLHVALGEVKNNARFAQPMQDGPKLTLVGNVAMGSVEIQYI